MADDTPAAHVVPTSIPRARMPVERRSPQSFLVLGGGKRGGEDAGAEGALYMAGLSGSFQAIFEVEVTQPGRLGRFGYGEAVDAATLLTDDRLRTGEPVYTFVSEPLQFGDLISGPPKRSTFTGRLVRGREGDGGQAFLRDVLVTVKRVVYAQTLREAAPRPPEAPRTLLFGDERHLFTAALRNGPEDGDHFEAVRVTGGVLTEAQAAKIRAGVLLGPEGVYLGRRVLPLAVEAVEPAVGE
jgi:hypothetical protein